MREIKFRAWVNSPECKLCVGFKEVPFIIYEIDDIDYKHGEFYFGGGFVCKLSDITLLEYIGLKDKNGKEIYEGDIVKTYFGVGEIVFNYGRFFVSSPHNLFVEIDDTEVIGNIYENPELLKE